MIAQEFFDHTNELLHNYLIRTFFAQSEEVLQVADLSRVLFNLKLEEGQVEFF